MTAVNTKFKADVAKFAQLVQDRVETVLTGVAVGLHSRLGDVTPYRTGRARASWNVDAWEPDLEPAPPLPFEFADPYNPTSEEIARANAFYDPIYDEKAKFDARKGTTRVVVSNNVDYIEDLNNGTSKQAPAGFFQATVAGMEQLVNEQIAKLKG